MERSGHLGLALLFISPVTIIATILVSPVWGVFTTIIAISVFHIPDLDQKVPTIKHRGISHTIWAALALGSISGAIAFWATTRLYNNPPAFLTETLQFTPTSPIIAATIVSISILIVYLSHILGDILTTGSAYFGMDIRPLFPVSKSSFQLRIFNSDSLMWNILFFSIGAAVHGGLLYLLVL